MAKSLFHLHLLTPVPVEYIKHRFQNRFLLAYCKSLFLCVPGNGRVKRSDATSYSLCLSLSLPERCSKSPAEALCLAPLSTCCKKNSTTSLILLSRCKTYRLPLTMPSSPTSPKLYLLPCSSVSSYSRLSPSLCHLQPHCYCVIPFNVPFSLPPVFMISSPHKYTSPKLLT